MNYSCDYMISQPYLQFYESTNAVEGSIQQMQMPFCQNVVFSLPMPLTYPVMYPQNTYQPTKSKFDYSFGELECQEHVPIVTSNPPQNSKKQGNIRTVVIKDFIKAIKNDGTNILLVKAQLKLDYPLKKFISQLGKHFPSDANYIRFKTLQTLCTQHPDREFSILLRTIFCHFLAHEYRLVIMLKKKKNGRMGYLKVCRQMLCEIGRDQPQI